jgi:transcriptional regulator GlxA family with amidase domain
MRLPRPALRPFVKVLWASSGRGPSRERILPTLPLLADEPGATFADVSTDAGDADQSHMNRHFWAFCGLSPREYERRAPSSPNHVSE